MNDDISVKNDVVIPGHEIEIRTSRSGGSGGQHVNKTNTRITLRWNIEKTSALDDIQKQRVRERLAGELTHEGDIVIHNSESRSQMHNKKAARTSLGKKIAKALYVKKRRMKTVVSLASKEARIKNKKRRSEIKTMRSKKFID
jgi:ribosome-associated protein